MPMQKALQNQKIAILAANGVTESHMTEIQKNMMKAGAFVRIVSIDHAIINSWNGTGWGVNYAVDTALNTALGVDFDMLIVPGGERSVEKLAKTPHTKRFVSSFMRLNRPVGVIEDGERLLTVIDTDTAATNVVCIDENEMSVMISHFTENIEDIAEAA